MAKDSGGLSDAEKAAVRERSRELRAQKKGKKGEEALLAAIAEMAESDRVIAEKIHEIVQTVAPDLEPKTHYGMPAYARDGKVVLFFQAASKYATRYPTLGFDEKANLDDGVMWPTAFAVTAINPEVEKKITQLVEKAIR